MPSGDSALRAKARRLCGLRVGQGAKRNRPPFLSSKLPLEPAPIFLFSPGVPRGADLQTRPLGGIGGRKHPGGNPARLKIRFAASLLRARSPLGAGGRGARSPVPPQAQAHRPAPRTWASETAGSWRGSRPSDRRQPASQPARTFRQPFPSSRGGASQAEEPQRPRATDPKVILGGWLSVEAACQKSSAGDSGARAPSDRLWPALPPQLQRCNPWWSTPAGESLLSTAGQHQPGKEEREGGDPGDSPQWISPAAGRLSFPAWSSPLPPPPPVKPRPCLEAPAF